MSNNSRRLDNDLYDTDYNDDSGDSGGGGGGGGGGYQSRAWTNPTQARQQMTQLFSNGLSQVKTTIATGTSSPSWHTKHVYTIVYCLSFWNFGVCMAIYGPTLLDFACQTSSSIGVISVWYFLQNLTALVGCFLSGIFIKKLK